MIIEKIQSPVDLKSLNINDLYILSEEIRQSLIKKASLYGGHLGSNLSTVELIVSLHYVFDSPKDKIIFDVSHQTYTHKIICGRNKAFINQNFYDSVTGFTNPKESEHDLFNIGHTSTAISLATGIATARDLNKEKYNVIAFIGDSSLSGGESFEAINYIADKHLKMIIIINDNDMSIPENHGFIHNYLNYLNYTCGKTNNNIFKTIGFNYYFVDGHNIEELVKTFKRNKKISSPTIIHCRTIKGKGYKPAEINKEKWHHAHPFDITTGTFNKKNCVPSENYGSIVGNFLVEQIKLNKKIVAMTASVPLCFGLNKSIRDLLGENYIDVGICEQHLISMAGGLAKSGYKPIVVTESSFYQRAYDQLEQEICLNKLPIIMLIAFSGIYAHNDNTHIGMYDIPLLKTCQNLIFIAPSNKETYISALKWAINQKEFPIAIRIPWNGVHSAHYPVINDFSFCKYTIVHRGTNVAIFGLGSFFQIAEEVYHKLIQKGIKPTLIDPIFVNNCDYDTLDLLRSEHYIFVTIEDSIISGGFGSSLCQYFSKFRNIQVLNFGFKNNFTEKFNIKDVLLDNSIDSKLICNAILKILLK